jgi:hypothetical protein
MLYYLCVSGIWNVLMFGMGQVAACGTDEDDICHMEDVNGRCIRRHRRELAGPEVRHFLF